MKGRPTLELVVLLAAFLVISAVPMLTIPSVSQPSAGPADAAHVAESRLQGIDRQAAELAEQA